MKFPAFVLIGDPFLTEQKRKEILSTLAGSVRSPLPLTLRRGGETPIAEILTEARTLPFLVSAQAFCVRDADQLSKNDLALLDEYFKSPNLKSFFFFESESMGRDHPLAQSAAKAHQVFFLEPQSEKIVSHFVHEKLKSSGKKLSREAEELLQSKIGDSFLFLDSVLNQLILAAGEKDQIEAADIEALGERLAELETDDLLEALASRNVARALTAINDLLESNFRDFPSVAGLLHWQIRRFWEAKKWQAEGVPEREISLRLKLSSSRETGFYTQLRRFSLKKLEEILKGLFDLDWRLKSGRAEGRFEIEEWLVTSLL